MHGLIFFKTMRGPLRVFSRLTHYNREISLYVQGRIRVDVGHIFGVKTNPYLKIKYTFEIFHQPAVKL